MSRQITIDPVTRIEGHAKITIQLDDAGQVQDAHFHVTQYRGFEKFCEGRPFHEMPSLMARTCGICPVSHLIAGAKACDALLAVRVPATGVHLRKIMNLAQIAQSHALSFFYLSAPDLLLGMDAEPGQRNIFGIAAANPEMARDGVKLRQTGQKIIELLGGKRIHPNWPVPGGVSSPLTAEKRDQMLAMIPEAITITRRTLSWFTSVLGNFQPEIDSFANFPTLFMGLVGKGNTLEHYDGPIRFVDRDRAIVADGLKHADYQEYIAEAVEPHSYLKSPFYRSMGYPDGIYRVGPLARLNLVEKCGTPLADEVLVAFREVDRGSSFHNHYARLIELLYAWEKIELLLNEPDILSDHVRAFASPNNEEGVGISEAPRGTLIHHYEIDRNGLMKRANLIIATGHNSLAMDRGVAQVAKRFIKGDQITDGMLNRVEAVIRTYDPCLSCSTHAAGHMAMRVQVLAPGGEVLSEVQRG